MDAMSPHIKWNLGQKILFRFFFIFLLLLSQVAYNPLINLLGYGFREHVLFFNKPLKGIVSWLDDHIFHTGFLPKQHAIYFSDSHFGVVLFLAILLIAVLVCVVWTLIDKRSSNYNRFYFWFSNYLAYYIFLAMITYAVQKIIPIQAHYPTAPELLTRWGDLRNWEVLFRFMGTSPAYCMFCGWMELIASVLILFNRTRILGGLLMIIVLIQVVLFNVFYNNSIILLSGVLLLCSIFTIAKDLPKLFSIFIKLKPVSLVQYKYKFITPWKKYVMVGICFLPLWKTFVATKKAWIFYEGILHNQEKQKLYNVIFYQQENDTIQPLTTDTLRWKYVCFLDYNPSKQKAVIFDMQEKQSTYECKWDSLNRKLFFSGNVKDSVEFSYFTLPNGNLLFNGYWNNKRTRIQLSEISINSFNLAKDDFLFMQEDQ